MKKFSLTQEQKKQHISAIMANDIPDIISYTYNSNIKKREVGSDV